MIYVDTSALMKLVWPEQGTEATYAFVGDREDLISSALLTVEARQAAFRAEPAALTRVDLLLARFEYIQLSDAVIETASRLPDPMLRSLDAIHLATALLIRDDIDVLLSYDERLLTAASAHGLPTAAPA
ncbi:MAG TPA: type II toxin-antitoxin system VapC family toxin [Pseudonocardia sp.]|nr:type II toxin-antitoxin system VapC family toxin [Pseudonocardia sp.]